MDEAFVDLFGQVIRKNVAPRQIRDTEDNDVLKKTIYKKLKEEKRKLFSERGDSRCNIL